jgi:hypothetical protein
MLGYETEHMMLFKDMSTRDLLQRRATKKIADRTTKPEAQRHREGLVEFATDTLVREESQIMGNNDALAEALREGEDSESMWEMSPLIRAAISGRIAILDNIDRLPVGALSVLQSLIHERQALPLSFAFYVDSVVGYNTLSYFFRSLAPTVLSQVALHDGTRLVSSETYGRLQSDHGLTQTELAVRVRSDLNLASRRQSACIVVTTNNPRINITFLCDRPVVCIRFIRRSGS